MIKLYISLQKIHFCSQFSNIISDLYLLVKYYEINYLTLQNNLIQN